MPGLSTRPSAPIAARVTGIRAQAASTTSAPTYPSTLAQRGVRVGGAGRRRGAGDVEPRDGLAVGAGVADRPLEQVLQRAGQRPGVLGRADEQRVGAGDGRPEIRDRGMDGLALAVVVGVEVGQGRHAVVERRVVASGATAGTVRNTAVFVDPSRRLPETRRRRIPERYERTAARAGRATLRRHRNPDPLLPGPTMLRRARWAPCALPRTTDASPACYAAAAWRCSPGRSENSVLSTRRPSGTGSDRTTPSRVYPARSRTPSDARLPTFT